MTLSPLTDFNAANPEVLELTYIASMLLIVTVSWIILTNNLLIVCICQSSPVCQAEVVLMNVDTNSIEELNNGDLTISGRSITFPAEDNHHYIVTVTFISSNSTRSQPVKRSLSKLQ